MSKQKIIIFEGHDKSGKTTISTALSYALNIPIFKPIRDKYLWDPDCNLKYLTEGVTQFIEQTGASVILDRWHGSDYAYSQLFDRDISYRKIFDIDHRMSQMKALIVICFKDKEHFEHDKEDEEFINENQYQNYIHIMQEFGMKSSCEILLLDTSDQNLELQLKTIIDKLQ